MGRHDEGTKSGAERKGIYQRDSYSSSHRQAKLSIECTCCPSDEAHGDKHCHEYEGSGDQSGSDAVHGIDGGQVGRFVSFVKLGLHRLDYHNGIVHHSTDDQYQCKQRQHIQTETGYI